MTWTAVGDFAIDDGAFSQDINEIKNNTIALARHREHKYMGGSKLSSLLKSATVQDCVDGLDIEIDGTDVSGLTVECEVEVRTEDAGTTITPQVYNVTDDSVAGTGTACSVTTADYSGTNQRQSFTVTLLTGVNVYRLRATNSDANEFTFMKGSLRIYATA